MDEWRAMNEFDDEEVSILWLEDFSERAAVEDLVKSSLWMLD
jgi:hypothetical protein